MLVSYLPIIYRFRVISRRTVCSTVARESWTLPYRASVLICGPGDLDVLSGRGIDRLDCSRVPLRRVPGCAPCACALDRPEISFRAPHAGTTWPTRLGEPSGQAMRLGNFDWVQKMVSLTHAITQFALRNP